MGACVVRLGSPTARPGIVSRAPTYSRKGKTTRNFSVTRVEKSAPSCASARLALVGCAEWWIERVDRVEGRRRRGRTLAHAENTSAPQKELETVQRERDSFNLEPDRHGRRT